MGTISGINSLLSASASSSGVSLSSLLQAATGAASPGIDVNAAVQAAVYSAQAPERRWQAQQSTISHQIAALTGIQTALSSLTSDLTSLNDPTAGPLNARTASFTSSAINASVSPGSSAGTHSIAVQSLATAASWYSPAVLVSAKAGTSTLTITASDGSRHTFPSASGSTSLSTLAQSVNAASIGITASVITDASGSRLALVGSATGAASDFSVSYGVTGAASWSSTELPGVSSPLTAGSFQIGDGTSTAAISVSAGATLNDVAASINSRGLQLSATMVTTASGAHLDIAPQSGATVAVSNDPAFAFSRASTAANASLTVDGVPIASASNSVSGVVPGVTLQLNSVTPAGAPASLSVTPDSSAIQNALAKFVTDYNTAWNAVSSQFNYSSSSNTQGVLSGDSGLRSLQSALLGVAGYATSPLSPPSSPPAVGTLSDLGITMGNDGSLSLDASKLNSALVNPSAVQNFFQGAALNGFAQKVESQIAIFSSPINGSITQEIGNLNQQYTALGAQVDTYESGYVASQKTVLTAMYSKAEIALQQLPAVMKQIQAQLGGNGSGG